MTTIQVNQNEVISTEPTEMVQSTKKELSTKIVLTEYVSSTRTYSSLLPTSKVNRSETTTKPKITTEIITKTTPAYDYTEWGTWSVCSKSCGIGEKVRERNCLKNQCHQFTSETIECIQRGCMSREHIL